jgi:phenylpropionate dioxygenase-like ring-hydroxylating dioxygenase large terminal subunit
LNGKLAKAPKFDNVEGFEKEENGLFPIHVKIDSRGIVWVNLEASETPSIPWETRLSSSDSRPRLAEVNMDDYVYDHSWTIEGKYNWKAAADNYNEVCVTSPTTLRGTDSAHI